MPFDPATFQQHLNTIRSVRQNYSSGFAPGTPTLEQRKFLEDIRRYDQDFAEDKYRDRRDFAEGVRQFNAKLAADAVAGELSKKDYSEKERSTERSNTALRYLQARMKHYIGKSDVPFQRAIDDTIAYFGSSEGSAFSGEELLDAILRQAGELSKTDPAIRAAMDAGGNYFDTMGGRKHRWFYDLYIDKDRYTPPLAIDAYGNFVPAGIEFGKDRDRKQNIDYYQNIDFYRKNYPKGNGTY